MDRWIPLGLFLFILSYILCVLSSIDIADVDLWGYLAFGRLFWDSSRFPYQDVFSYVPTLSPWVYHEWLTGVLFYPIYQSFGPPGLQILKYGLGLATLGLIYMTARKRGSHPLVAGILLAVIAGGIKMSYTPVRAQVFTLFFFALALYVLEGARLSGRWRALWLLPLIYIPWGNLHGGFVAGLGLIGIYAAGEFLGRRPWLPYLGVLVLSVLLTLINPYGLQYWEYIVRAVSMPRPHVTEWASLFWLYQKGAVTIMYPVFVFLLVCLGLFAMWQSRWREVTASLALAVTLVLGLRHNRHFTFFFLLWGAYLPLCAKRQFEYLRSHPTLTGLWRKPRLKIGLFLALVFVTVLLGYQFVQRSPFDLKKPTQPTPGRIHYPVAAVNYIKKQGLSGKIVTIFGWGEYLIWELYPQCRVGFDGRYETVYPPEVETKYTEFIFAGPHWRQFLQSYPPDLILLDPRSKIARLIAKETRWAPVYRDSGSVLFVIKEPVKTEKKARPTG